MLGIFEERIPMNRQLLSPAGMPVQATCDISGFWKNAYAEALKI